VLNISCDISGPLAGIDELLGNDLPFTIARFLTLQAQSGQAAARAGERTLFKLRNDWTTQNTKITPAKKDTLFSEVYTDTSNHKTGAPDYLPRQQSGGDKVPVAGHNFLAIPTRYLRKYASDSKPIPDNLRPKALLPPGATAQIGVHYAGAFRGGRGNGEHRVLGKATLKKLGNGEFVAFFQFTKSGTLCLFVRHGGIGYGGAHDAEPWYVMVREARIKAIFPMEELVEKAVEADMEKNFDRAAAEVLVNNALKNGFRVKF
jgi:hypothetical protein